MDLRGWDVRGVAVGAVVAVLAGCTGDPDPVVTPTPSPTPTETVIESPSPTPSPTPTALTEEEVLAALPSYVTGDDFISAVLFSQFFIDLYPKMFADDQDPRLFEALSSPDCAFCEDAIASAIATSKIGAHSIGSEFSWEQPFLARGGLRDDGYWYLSQPFEVTAVTTYAADGTVLSQDEAGTGTVGVKLAWNGDRWQVHGVEFDYDDAH